MLQRQSYDSVIFAHKFNVYEMRIMLHVVNYAQELIKNKDKGAKFVNLELGGDGVNRNFSIPLSDLLASKSHNYKYLRDTLRRMQKDFVVEYYDREKKIWRSTTFLYNVSIEERSGLCKFSMADWLIGYIIDMRRGGYRLYDFEVAMSFSNASTARLYLLSSSATKPIYYPLEGLKKMLGLEDKYSRAAAFEQRVLEPARKELEDRNINGFTYESVRQYPHMKKSKVLGYRLIPVRRGDAEKSDSAAQQELAEKLPANIITYLSRQLHFSWREIKHIQDTLLAFMNIPGWEQKLASIGERSRRKNRSKGWIIKAIRGEVNIHRQEGKK